MGDGDGSLSQEEIDALLLGADDSPAEETSSIDAVKSYFSLYEMDNNPESILTLKHMEMLKNKKYTELINQLKDFCNDFSSKNYKNIFFTAASEFYLENYERAYDLLKNFFIKFNRQNSKISTEAEMNLINLGYLYYKFISFELELPFELNETRSETEEPYSIIPKHFDDIQLYGRLHVALEIFNYSALDLYFYLIVKCDFDNIQEAMPTKNQIDLSVVGKNKILTFTDNERSIFKYLIYHELLSIYNKFCHKLVLATYDTSFILLPDSSLFHLYKAEDLYTYGYYEEALFEIQYILDKNIDEPETHIEETLKLQTLIKEKLTEESLSEINSNHNSKFDYQ
jgi:hypothetical protein